MSDDGLNPRLAERLARAARAAQTLSEVLWEALHEELTAPRAQRVAELSERLGDVSATVALLARADAVTPPAPEPPGVPESSQPLATPSEPEPAAARVIHEHDESRSPVGESPSAQEQPSAAVLVDELALPESSEIEIRDERHEDSRRESAHREGPSAWIASIGRRLERHERDGAPFAVLLVELVDVERLRHAELPGEVARLTGLIETALSNELRPADSLTRENPGRYWLLAPETDSDSARALAERLAGAVRGTVSHRGAPLQVAVGIAVCPADGSQAAALAAHADIALFAARAAGRPLA